MSVSQAPHQLLGTFAAMGGGTGIHNVFPAPAPFGARGGFRVQHQLATGVSPEFAFVVSIPDKDGEDVGPAGAVICCTTRAATRRPKKPAFTDHHSRRRFWPSSSCRCATHASGRSHARAISLMTLSACSEKTTSSDAGSCRVPSIAAPDMAFTIGANSALRRRLSSKPYSRTVTLTPAMVAVTSGNRMARSCSPSCGFRGSPISADPGDAAELAQAAGGRLALVAQRREGHLHAGHVVACADHGQLLQHAGADLVQVQPDRGVAVGQVQAV